jgi:DNA polymerase III epsilon subunit family exonuclease
MATLTTPGAASATLLRERTLCVIDVETTGFSPRTERIVEIAMVRVEPGGRISERWSTLVDPGRDPGPSHVHGIAAHDLHGAPTMEELAPAITERLAGCVLVAHNVAFDRPFLDAELLRCGAETPDVQQACTLEAARRHLSLASNKLAAVCDHFGIALTNAHSALADAEATAAVCYSLLAVAEARGRGRIAWHRSMAELVPVDELTQPLTRAR